MCIIAIDCGASFIKASRLNCDGVIECSEKRSTPDRDESGLRIEKTIQIVEELIGRLAETSELIKVGFSTEMHGFIIADREGNPLTDYISWQDESGLRYYNECTFLETVQNLLTEKDAMSTGMPIKVGLPNVNLFYQLCNALSGISRESMYFYTLGDYLIRRLSNQEPYIHITNAAATGLCCIQTRKWNESIINKLGMQGIHFPTIVDGPEVVIGEMFGKKISFYPALGDQQAALWGSDFREKDCLSINFGTGAQVSIISDEFVERGKYQVRPYLEGMYLLTIPHIPSGRALNVYFRFVKEILAQFTNVTDDEIWMWIMNEAEQDGLENLDVDMSFFTNAITQKTVGSICNIQEHTFTVGNLFRSAFRTMAVNARNMVHELGGNNIDTIVFSGGIVAKNPLLREMMMKELNVCNATIAVDETIKGIYKYVIK